MHGEQPLTHSRDRKSLTLGRWRAIAVLPVVLLSVSCSSDPNAASPMEAVAEGAMQHKTGTGTAHGDRRGIQQLVDDFMAAWASKDAVAYGANYSENAEFVNPFGTVIQGRAALAGLHAIFFAGGLATSTLTLDVTNIDFLTGTIAIVDLNQTLTGYGAVAPPGIVETEPGFVRVRVRWLAVKQQGQWEILVSYYRGWGHS